MEVGETASWRKKNLPMNLVVIHEVPHLAVNSQKRLPRRTKTEKNLLGSREVKRLIEAKSRIEAALQRGPR